MTQIAAGGEPQPGAHLQRPALRLRRKLLRPARQRHQQQHLQPKPDAGPGHPAGGERPGDPDRRRLRLQPGADLQWPALRFRRKLLRPARQRHQQRHQQPEPDAEADLAAGSRRPGDPDRRRLRSQPGADLRRPALRLRRKLLRPARQRHQQRHQQPESDAGPGRPGGGDDDRHDGPGPGPPHPGRDPQTSRLQTAPSPAGHVGAPYSATASEQAALDPSPGRRADCQPGSRSTQTVARSAARRRRPARLRWS